MGRRLVSSPGSCLARPCPRWPRRGCTSSSGRRARTSSRIWGLCYTGEDQFTFVVSLWFRVVADVDTQEQHVFLAYPPPLRGAATLALGATCCMHTLAETPQPPPESLPGAATLAPWCDVLWHTLSRSFHLMAKLAFPEATSPEASVGHTPNMLPPPPAVQAARVKPGGLRQLAGSIRWMSCVCAPDKTPADAWGTPGICGRNSHLLVRGPWVGNHISPKGVEVEIAFRSHFCSNIRSF